MNLGGSLDLSSQTVGFLLKKPWLANRESYFGQLLYLAEKICK